MKRLVIFLLLLISATTFGQKSATIAYGDNPNAGHSVQAGDAKIYYEVYGKGKPVVLLHGGGGVGSIDEMAQFIDSLSKTVQVIAINTRGHGRSEIGHSPVTYEQKVADVMAAINDVTKDSVVVLGFSDGAYTGYKLASMHPARVKKLIAIGAGEQVPGLRKVILNTAIDQSNPYWKKRLATYPEPQRIPEYLKNLENFYNTMIVSKELFGNIKCPVLVLAGERDLNAPLATVIAAYQMIPISQLGIIPKAGHVVFIENFPAVWASVAPFIRN